MSNKEVKDRDLEDVSGGAVDLQQTSDLTAKTDSTGGSGSGSGGPGDPGYNDMEQNNDDGPASGA
jgi:hypothetical protein